MSSNITTIRQRIQAQGFCGYDDITYQQLNYPLRLSPTLCMLWAAIGTYLASPLILWSLVPFAALGAILPGHPFDSIYNYGLRHINQTPRIPVYPARRRFACVMATVMTVITAWGFQNNMPLLGQIMGWALVAAAFVNVSTGFCVPSFIARMAIGKKICSS